MKPATIARILDRIASNTNVIYNASTFTSRTQARLREIEADVALLREGLVDGER